MKYIYLILATIFLIFSVLQYNDPDPLTWIALYGYAAVLSFFMFVGKLKNITWPLIGLIAYAVTAYIYYPNSFQGMENAMTLMRPEIEQARETSGMGICIAVMVAYIIVILRNKKTVPS